MIRKYFGYIIAYFRAKIWKPAFDNGYEADETRFRCRVGYWLSVIGLKIAGITEEMIIDVCEKNKG